MTHLIAPSILSADFNQLAVDFEMINRSQADWFHVDVMDGLFVPNISFGFPVIKALKKVAKKPLDVHLMIEKPDRYISEFVLAGADILTVHLEACTHLHRSIQAIKSEGIMAGVAVNPHSSVDLLKDVLPDLDLVCLMSVNPGFGGQKFIRNTLTKIHALDDYRKANDLHFKIEIDGGVTLDNYREILNAGADVLVAGSAVFKSENPEQTIASLKK